MRLRVRADAVTIERAAKISDLDLNLNHCAILGTVFSQSVNGFLR